MRLRRLHSPVHTPYLQHKRRPLRPLQETSKEEYKRRMIIKIINAVICLRLKGPCDPRSLLPEKLVCCWVAALLMTDQQEVTQSPRQYHSNHWLMQQQAAPALAAAAAAAAGCQPCAEPPLVQSAPPSLQFEATLATGPFWLQQHKQGHHSRALSFCSSIMRTSFMFM